MYTYMFRWVCNPRDSGPLSVQLMLSSCFFHGIHLCSKKEHDELTSISWETRYSYTHIPTRGATPALSKLIPHAWWKRILNTMYYNMYLQSTLQSWQLSTINMTIKIFFQWTVPITIRNSHPNHFPWYHLRHGWDFVHSQFLPSIEHRFRCRDRKMARGHHSMPCLLHDRIGRRIICFDFPNRGIPSSLDDLSCKIPAKW